MKKGDLITADYLNSLSRGGVRDPRGVGFTQVQMGDITEIPRFQVRPAPNSAFILIEVWEDGFFQSLGLRFGSAIGSNPSRFTLAVAPAISDMSYSLGFASEVWGQYTLLPYKEQEYTEVSGYELLGESSYMDDYVFQARSVANFSKENGIWACTKEFMPGKLTW